MAKCNTQAKDMATTANNWQTPGATNPGRYSASPKLDAKWMMHHHDDLSILMVAPHGCVSW